MEYRHGIIPGSRAQIRMPRLGTADRIRQRLAEVIRARYSAKVCAVRRTLAGSKETHRGTGGCSLRANHDLPDHAPFGARVCQIQHAGSAISYRLMTLGPEASDPIDYFSFFHTYELMTVGVGNIK